MPFLVELKFYFDLRETPAWLFSAISYWTYSMSDGLTHTISVLLMALELAENIVEHIGLLQEYHKVF
jgi:hypothetical protein